MSHEKRTGGQHGNPKYNLSSRQINAYRGIQAGSSYPVRRSAEQSRRAIEPPRLCSDLRAFEIRAIDYLGRLPYSRKLHFGSPAAFPMRPKLAVIQPTNAFHLWRGLSRKYVTRQGLCFQRVKKFRSLSFHLSIFLLFVRRISEGFNSTKKENHDASYGGCQS